MGGECNLPGADVIIWGQLQRYWGKCSLTGVGLTFGVSCNPVGSGALPVFISRCKWGGRQSLFCREA